jgi:hypothetical protein
MPAWSIPQILVKEWFWLAIMAGLFVVLHSVRKRYPPPFPKSRQFLRRRRTTIKRAMDVFAIGAVLLCSLFLLYPLRGAIGAWGAPSEPREVRAVLISSSFIDMVVWSGVTGPVIGFLSFFQSSLTRFKRIVLLILCLLPPFFTAVALLAGSIENWRSAVQLGAMFSAPTWVVNGPGVLIGQPLPNVLWRIMCKLRLASGDLPD